MIIKRRASFTFIILIIVTLAVTGCDIDNKTESADDTESYCDEEDMGDKDIMTEEKTDFIEMEITDNSITLNDFYSGHEQVPFNGTIDDFVVGAIKVSDGSGSEVNNQNRMRTGFWPLGEIVVNWDTNSGLQYLVAFYDKDYTLLGSTAFRSDSAIINESYFYSAELARFIIKYNDESPFDASFSLPEGCAITTDAKLETTWDTPQTAGVRHLIERANQCVDITYKTAAILPGQKGDIDIHTEVTGIMYSSTRKESLYVPNAVSFETYITAILNPNSYIYTRTSDNYNSKTYYGTVCSAFASYCYDLPCIYTTHQLGELENFEFLVSQNIDDLQLGDMMLKESSHACIIVGIERDAEGRVYSIIEAEARAPMVLTKRYYRNSFIENWTNKGYNIYRYAKVNSIPTGYSKWADPNEEYKNINAHLSPRRGNKSNWPASETVEIDVFNYTGFDRAVLFRDGSVVSSLPIPKDKCISYENLEPGTYNVYISGPEEWSDPVSFIVADTHIGVEDIGGGKAKITFSSSNATPKWLAWCYSDPESKDYMAVVRAFEITDEDLERGYAITEYEPGEWLFKVEFETDYGLLSSEFAQVSIN